MQLKRTNKEAWANISAYPATNIVGLDFSADGNVICSLLDEREVDDLITMLQYYKLQVWPNSKENH
jgi:hypothetical protein